MVDDLIITGKDPAAILSFKKHLSSNFHMKDFGALKFLFAIEVTWNSKGIYLCKWKYAFDIFIDARLLNAKPLDFLMEQHDTLGKAKGPFLPSLDSYR